MGHLRWPGVVRSPNVEQIGRRISMLPGPYKMMEVISRSAGWMPRWPIAFWAVVGLWKLSRDNAGCVGSGYVLWGS